MTTYGELFAGYGGMHLGLSTVIPGELSWFSEIAKPPAKVMAHHHPAVPNLGDVTKVDWSTVPPVDVLTGGTPCQDLSSAGKRAGMRAGTRSGLWQSMAEAIDTLHPSLVVWENVRGATSASAFSSMEPCAGCVGGAAGEHSLRALGRVLGDLASLRYDAWWIGLPASDLGAAHKRYRLFVFATPATHHGRLSPQIPIRWGNPTDTLPSSNGAQGRAEPAGELTLLPTPTSSEATGAGVRGSGGINLRTAILLLPTPAVNDIGSNKTVEWWDEWTAELDARLGNGNGHGKSLGIELRRAEGLAQYQPALDRWATVIGRPAPHPTEPAPRVGVALSPRFGEWMMGLPDGYISAVPGISSGAAVAMLGNGVVPQQIAAAAATWLGETA